LYLVFQSSKFDEIEDNDSNSQTNLSLRWSIMLREHIRLKKNVAHVSLPFIEAFGIKLTFLDTSFSIFLSLFNEKIDLNFYPYCLV